MRLLTLLAALSLLAFALSLWLSRLFTASVQCGCRWKVWPRAYRRVRREFWLIVVGTEPSVN